jgi:hypothetical protein
MTPEQKAQEMELRIKSLGFQVDTYRGRKIASIILEYILEELKDIDGISKYESKDPIMYYKEVEEEVMKLF